MTAVKERANTQLTTFKTDQARDTLSTHQRYLPRPMSSFQSLFTRLAEARERHILICSPKLPVTDSSSLLQDRQHRKCPVSNQAPCPKCPRLTCHLCQRCQRSTVIGPRPLTSVK